MTDRRIDVRSPVPAYQQLADSLRQRIEAREWPTGPLPSIEYLQGEYGVGRDTVMHAIKILADDGIVYTIARRGTYVTRNDHG
jgi:DNA-binding GntR family transcriptional regulator